MSSDLTKIFYTYLNFFIYYLINRCYNRIYNYKMNEVL